MNFSARRALASSWSVHPGAKFIREPLKEQAEVLDRAKESLDLPFLFSQADSSSSQ